LKPSLIARAALCVVAAATVLVAAACTTVVGREFDISAADSLRPGVSTRADAVAALGVPTSESAAGSGTLLQWQYSKGQWMNGSGAHLAILFDRDGRMVKVTQRTQIP
jgi:outer membrane protein assembly factor BamE (lipoprotein component of BamABCDE complex)